MQLTAHLLFDGNCRAAFTTYQRVLGGRILTMLTHGDAPGAAGVPPSLRDKIAHATLDLGDGASLNGADVLPAQYAKPRGFYVLVSPTNVVDAKRIFTALAEGGEVHLAIARTFWSPAFGVLVDRFGIPWEVNCESGRPG